MLMRDADLGPYTKPLDATPSCCRGIDAQGVCLFIAGRVSIRRLYRTNRANDDGEQLKPIQALAAEAVGQVAKDEHAESGGADCDHVDGEAGLAKVVVLDRIDILERGIDDIA